MEQLIALGYLEPRGEDAARHLASARQQQSFTLARIHLAAGRLAEAIQILEGLIQDRPGDRSCRLFLAQAYREAGRLDDCRAVLDPILQEDAGGPVANLLRGNLAIAEGDYAKALEHLSQAELDTRPLPAMRLALGRVYLGLARWEDAERVFRGVLAIDPDDAGAHSGLARAMLGQKQPEAAAAAALDAVALRFDDFGAHYILGAALAQTGNVPRSTQAFQTCLKLRPDMAGLGRP